MGRNMAIVISDEEAKSAPSTKSLTDNELKVNDGDKVTRGQRLAEWDPYTRPS